MNSVVSKDEYLARFIIRPEHVRADGTVKPDPFIPYKWVELSVTRHIGLTEVQIWAFGGLVASNVGKRLQGRGDAQAEVFLRQSLSVVASPETTNPNHANVVGWPVDKHAQKAIALELVKDVRFKKTPAPVA